MATTIPHKFNIVRFQRPELIPDIKISTSLYFNFSMSGINSGHYYLPTYQILMISENVEFLPPIFYAVFWQPLWKWQTFWKFWKRRIAPLMVTYHYVKFYVSIIIHLEVININVRNFNFPIGFYSNHHTLWTPQNMTLTPFTTKLKTLGPTRNIYPDILKRTYLCQVSDTGSPEPLVYILPVFWILFWLIWSIMLGC
jgi:hypothetical protein